MSCSIRDLQQKEVICINDGARLGFVSDVEIDIENGKLVAMVIPGAYRFMGMFGKEENYVIRWDHIKKIGGDIILVDIPENKYDFGRNTY